MEQNIDFGHMDIGSVEVLVGRKVIDAQVKNKSVVCLFSGLNTALPNNHTGVGANISVSFNKW